MPPLSIDTDVLMRALTYAGADVRYMLDLHTGEIFLLAQEPTASVVELPGRREAVEGEPTRFAAIVPVGSGVQWEWMREFTAQANDPAWEQALSDALAQEQPFRGFQAVLRENSDLRKQWRRYREERMLAAVRAWLAVQGIEAELQPLLR